MTALCLLVAVLGGPLPVAAAGDESAAPEVEPPMAPVEIDGRVLFRVRGASSLPAELRARAIRDRILAIARDPGVRIDTLRLAEQKSYVSIMAGERMITGVGDADASLEGLSRYELAMAHRAGIQRAIADYRQARDPKVLTRNAVYAAGATIVLAAALFVLMWLLRRLDALVARRAAAHLRTVELQSFELVKAESLLSTLRSAVRGLRIASVVVLGLLYLQFVLSRLPWTRGFAENMLRLVTEPMHVMGMAFVTQIPNLIFLVILFSVVRLGLRLLRLFFDAVARGRVTLAGFEADWARPTYKIVRFAVVAFAVVVAYPYVPGSDTAAFKGVSIFIGLVFSLGSSSVIANVIAGYAMTYRRLFKVGDRVKLGGTIGDVIEIRPQVTHLRSLKNEQVIVPNSVILNAEVVNYSSLAAQHGLILHTRVGIGYETPWRQVEAMLLLAAERTPGLAPEPCPYVRHRALGDFAVDYELNVGCSDARQMMPLYTALHRSILDVFNEYGVQIMTPAYEGDPKQPKLVPRDQWYVPPAVPARPATTGSAREAGP